MSKTVARVAIGLVAFIGAVTFSAAATDDTPSIKITLLAHSITHSALFGLSFEGSKGVAVGEYGLIVETDDGGQHWKTVPQAETDLAMLSVSRRGTHTVAVGQSGLVMVEESPGQWKKYSAGPDARLLGVSVNSSGVAIAVGQFGTVLKSADGGHTWSDAKPDWNAMASADTFGTGEPTMYAVNVDDNNVVTIAGEYGVIMRSNDGGTTWSPIRKTDPNAATIFAMSIAKAGEGRSFAVGQAGEVLTSDDGGATWERHPANTQQNFLGVASTKDGNVVVTGMHTMARSTDNGATWTFSTDSDTTTEWYQAVRAEDASGPIFAVGHAARIIRVGS